MKPLTFEQIMEQPKPTRSESEQFLVEQYFMRDVIWHNKHSDLFKSVGLFDKCQN
jgi:hypothetical protein